VPDLFLEIAEITVKSGFEAEFEKAVAKAAPLFAAANGCRGLDLQRSQETPTRYLLFVSWDSIENHMVDFRNSPAFAEWRACVGHCFEQSPKVEHVRNVFHGFGKILDSEGGG
jgi:heme-degrading monooxygenase HmoA